MWHRTLTFGTQGGQAGSLSGRRSSFGRRSEGIDAPPPPPADDSAIQNSGGLPRAELPLQLRPLSRVPLLLYAAPEPGGAQKVSTIFGRLWACRGRARTMPRHTGACLPSSETAL